MVSRVLDTGAELSDSEFGVHLEALDLDISGLQTLLFDGAEEPAAYERTPTKPAAQHERHLASDKAEKRRSGSSSAGRRRVGDERRRLQLVASARRHRNRKKNEHEELLKEAVFLERQLELLRLERMMTLRSESVAQWEERAVTARHHRRRVEAVNEQLRGAVYRQSHFVRGLHSVFSRSPLVNNELNLHKLLHSRSHLGLSAAYRQRECLAMYTDAKLDLARQILLRETDGVSLEYPSITSRQVAVGEGQFGVTSVGSYAFETEDMVALFCIAIGSTLRFVQEWPNLTVEDSSFLSPDSPNNTHRYAIYSTRYVDNATGERVMLAGNAMLYYRVTASYIVGVWDFVDKDELHPLPSDMDIRLDAVGALLIQQEVCEDGVQRLVCRTACTKVHTFQPRVLPSAVKSRMVKDLVSFDSDKVASVVYNAVTRGEYVPCDMMRTVQATV